MSRLGIVDLLGLGATLVFAVPIGVFGVQLLLEGRPIFGLVGVLVAIALVVVERVLWTPEDVVGAVTDRIAEVVVERPPDEKQR